MYFKDILFGSLIFQDYVYQKSNTIIMTTKTQELRQKFNSGDIKTSLRIFKSFKIGVTKDQKRDVEIAYESMTGKKEFYESLGINTQEKCKQAIQTIQIYLLDN